MNRKPGMLTQIIWLLFLAACSAQVKQPEAALPTSAAVPTRTQTAVPIPIPPAAPTSTIALATSTSIPLPSVCSPLENLPIDQLAGQISNPYQPPPVGSDNPHQGVDLADLLPGSQMAVSGRRVQAVMAGQVSMVIRDRFPYGNAILIETPLDLYPAEGWEGMQIPTPAPTLAAVQALTCPAGVEPKFSRPDRRSLYLLYAHLQDLPDLSPGDSATCGQAIGRVGSSGNAMNPHLHFEARVGPSGLQMTSMAHYDASASAEEMSSYCMWRVSGLFQLVDPMKIFTLTPNMAALGAATSDVAAPGSISP
jgi:murein DD-endopeptidase MepM/ murein hydrolase activator NlpD